MIFEFDHFLASKSPITVSYRIDKNKAQMNRRWSVSTDGTAIFADNLDQFRLAKKMMSGQSLYLKTKDFRGTTYSMRISLKGSSMAIQKVLNTCEMSDDYFKKLGIE
ncbi:hypothetical protein [Marinomonas sp. PE14-40]|uniref:hypothetical protein n=1 Tax=Marinomonas sp. PE14-40 TaxID=3060621 RepID=UPI003F680842